MNSNGRKISSKYFLILIFTALFFSVTFNSPANYLSVARFIRIVTIPKAAGDEAHADTTRPRVRMGPDSVLPRATLPALALLRDTVRDSVLRPADSMLAARRVDTPDYVISKD